MADVPMQVNVWLQAGGSRLLGLSADENCYIDLTVLFGTYTHRQKLALNFVDKWPSLSRYSSLAD
jgi:hypothetical protein